MLRRKVYFILSLVKPIPVYSLSETVNVSDFLMSNGYNNVLQPQKLIHF